MMAMPRKEEIESQALTMARARCRVLEDKLYDVLEEHGRETGLMKSIVRLLAMSPMLRRNRDVST
jgi:hypothetical protein